MKEALLWAAGGTGFTFGMTALGSAMVFFFRKRINDGVQRIFLGFAAGVMIAASVWSLLIPAIEEAQAAGGIGWVPAAFGFVLGAAFLMLLDTLLPHLHAEAVAPEGVSSSWKRTTLLVLAVTLHNIPEGMAVGLSFARAAQHGGNADFYAGAFALALGIGIQNFPEGAIISMPLRSEGASKWKSFAMGTLSGAVEPVGAVLMILLLNVLGPALPYFLSFAAGAMIYVVVEELIPTAQTGGHKETELSTMGCILGFTVMMILDVALS